jgi:hypothetical protein
MDMRIKLLQKMMKETKKEEKCANHLGEKT